MKENNGFEKAKGFASSFLNKASDLGKKAADGIQKGADSVSEKMKAKSLERRKEKLNPLFPDEFEKRKNTLPNIIQIVSDVERKDIDVCEGAIGWSEIVNEEEVFFLYEEFAEDCGIRFIPVRKRGDIYCADRFNKNTYINASEVHKRASDEKLAELEHIAYMLGAKRCCVEIVESEEDRQSAGFSFSLKHDTAKANGGASSSSGSLAKQSGKGVSKFEGARQPRRPKLKWFADDDNINNLVDMCCTDERTIKHKTLELNGVYSSSISRKVACAVDKLGALSGKLSLERDAIKEHCSKLLFEIEF